MKIQVLGSGCPTCKKLHENVIKIVKDENIDAEVEYSTDITRIADLGLMRSPVLVINGKPSGLKTFEINDIKNTILGEDVKNEDNSSFSGGCSCEGNC